MSLKRNTMWNLIGSVTPMALGIVTIPFLISETGVEPFGILTLVWSLIGYFSVFDFGIGRALTHQVSTYRSGSQPLSKLGGIVRTGLQFMLIAGTLGGLALVALARPLGQDWLNVSPSLRIATERCLLISALGIPLATLTSGLRGVLEGFEEFRAASMLRLLLGLSNFGLPALSALLFGPSLTLMVGSLVLARLAVVGGHLVAVNRYLPLREVWQSARASIRETRVLIQFGAWMTASNIISPLMVSVDRFIIASMLGASVVAFYTVPFDLIFRLLIMPAALTGALFPRFSFMFARQDPEFRLVYRRSLTVILAGMGLISISVAAGSFFGLTLWLGRAFAEQSWLVASILSIGLLANSLAQVPFAAVQATGGVKVTSAIHLAEACAYLPLLYLCVREFGLVGAAWMFVLRVTADLVLLGIVAKRRMPSEAISTSGTQK
jgi:O-antigen/teichoic acid export membrane protein